MIGRDDETSLHREVDIYQVSKPAQRFLTIAAEICVCRARTDSPMCVHMDKSSHWDLPEILGGP